MKIYRPLVVLLLAFICGLTVSAQDSSELTSLRAKAVKGNGIAQYNLGLAYAEGHGVAADPIEAFVWLSLARENGARGRALDNLVGSLDKAAYATAQKRLAERKAELGHRPSTVTSTPAPATGETPAAPDTKPAAAAVPTPVQPAPLSEDPALNRLRTERETLSAQVADLTGTVSALRAERERLVKLSADREKADREAAEAVKAELERTKQSLAALQQAPKPAADTTALDQRIRELQAVRAELEASRNFGSQVESSLNKVTDQKTALETQLAAAATEASRARQEATALAQAKDEAQKKLSAIAAEHTALQSEVSQLRQRPAAPAYPDLSAKVGELEAKLATAEKSAAAKPVAPAYPDLSGRVRELESSLADTQRQLAAKPAATEQKTRGLQAALAELETARNFGTQVESTLNKVTSQKTALETQLAASVTEATALAQAKNEAQKKLGAITAEHTALQSEVAQLRQRPAAPAYPDLSGRVQELESSLADTQRQLAAKPAAPKYPDLSGRVHELESSLADAQHQLAAKPAAPAYPDLRTNVAALETQLTTAQQALAAKSKPATPAYPDLSSRVTELEKQLTAVSTGASQAKQAAQAEAQLLGQKLTQAEVARQQTQESYTALQAEAGKLRARPATPAYPDLSGRVAELETALAVARKPVAPAYPDLSDRVREQERQTEALRATVAASAQELADTRGKLAAMSAGLSTAASAQADAKAQAAALTKARDEAQQQLNAIMAEHTALQSEVAQLRQRPAAPAYPDLSGRVAELETALAAARKLAMAATPDLSGKVSELEQALADTNRQLIAAQNAAAAKPAAPGYPDLSGKVSELEAALATATQKAGATEQARAEVAKQFDDFKSSTITAQRERTTMLAQVKMLESDKAALRRQAEAATAETGQLRSQVAALKMQQVAIKPAAPAYPDLSGKVGALEAQVGNLTAALAAKPAAPAYPDLSGRVSELEGQLAQARQPAAPKYPDLSGRVRELESSLADAQHQLAAKPADPKYPDLSGRVRELEAQVSSDKSAVASANEEAVRAKQEAATLAQAKAAAQTQAADLTTERDRARSAQTELRDTIARLTEEKAQLAAASKAAPAYPDLHDQVATLESNLAASQKALAAKPAAPTYPDLSNRVGELEAALAASGRQGAAELSTATEQIAQLKSALEAKPAAPGYPDLSGRVTELEAALVAAKNAAPAYPDLSAKVSELETKLTIAEKSAAAKPAAPAYPDLSSRVADLTGEVAQLRADRERMQKLLADAGRNLGEATAATRGRPVAPPGYLDRVHELETALAQAKEAAKPAAPAFPDLSGRVRELEAAVADSARQLIAAEAAQTGLKQQLAGTNTALQNAAKGGDDSAKLGRERDELSGRVTDLASEVAQVRADRERMQKMLADTGRQLRDNTADAARIKDLETQQAGLRGSLAAAQAQANELKSALAARNGAPAYPDLSGKVSELESKLAAAENAAATKPAAPAYPDLSGRVHELEAQVAAAPRGRAPAYPDLSGRVNELEAALAEARQRPAVASTSSAPAAGGDSSELQKKLADTEDRLATSLRGYAMVEKERDELTARAGKATETGTAEKNALAAQVATLSGEVAQLRASAQNNTGSTQTEIARLNEALTALQRSTAQNSADLAATRALAQQLQGANAVLAGENYQLKTMLSRTVNPPGAVATAPTAVPASRTHVVASGDSLSRLSQRYYGTANRWQEIYNANSDRIAANGLLRIGTELRIP